MTFPTTQNDQEDFQDFFEQWIAEQKQQLQELIAASKSQDAASLPSLMNRVINHYEEYYKVKSRAVKDNVFLMLSPTWTTLLEDGFLWIGGWRPSMAFQLLYSKSGLQLEAQLAELTQTGDLGDLGSIQMVRVDQLQRKTIKEEREITEKMAKQQETVADAEMVELSGLMENNSESGLNDRVDSVLTRKEEGLMKVMGMADDLRLRTLKGVVEILSPKQAVHFLIAGAELHLRMHDLGNKLDAKGK